MSRHIRIWTIAGAAALIAAPALTQDTFTYDELGRLKQVDYDDGQVSKYNYDPAGNRTLVEQGGAPAPQDDTASAALNTAKDINVLANDTDLNGDTLTIPSTTNPANGSTLVIQVSGADWVRYTPNTGYSGPDSFSYTVTDGITQVTANVTVDVISNNGAPVADDELGETTDEDTPVTISVLVGDTDPDNDPLSIGTITAPSNGTATKSGSDIIYDPDPNFFGADSFTYEASDGSLSDTGSVTVTVVSVNDVPVANPDAFTKAEDTPHTFDPRANDTDADGDALTITSVTNPPNGTATKTSTSVTYTPDPNYNGPDSFDYTISDGNGGVNNTTITVTITAVEDPPDAVDDTKSTNEDTQITFDPRTNDSDPEGQPLTITAVSNPTNGTTSKTSASVTYTPNANYSGSDSFTYTISDGALTDTATVNMTVNAVNDPPVAGVDNYANVDKANWTVFSVLNNDSDAENDTLTITAASGALGATAQVWNNGTQVRYTCSGCGSSATFSYTISDGNGGTDHGAGVVNHSSGGGLDP